MNNPGLDWLDGVVLLLYVGFVIGIGLYYGRRQKSTDEYFVGNRAMNATLIGVSLFATLFSTITYLSTPGEYIAKGPAYAIQVLAMPIVFFLVGYLLIPFYMRRRVTSTYELVEDKLGLEVRLLAATLFVLMRLFWMALLIYMASGAILGSLQWEKDSLPWIVLATGSVAIFYASIGGLRAVVITDLLQCILLFGGAVLVITTVTINLDGFGWFPTSWQEGWDTQPLFSWDPNVRLTVVGTLLTTVLWWVCTAGADQTAIQRFMATGSPKAARSSFRTSCVAGVGITVLLALVGFALLGYFQAHPAHIPEGMTLETAADSLFHQYISIALPPGVAGLILAALFAAAMSSIDSGVNSITAVVLTDYVERFRKEPLSEKARVVLARVLAVTIGLVVITLGAYVIGNVPGKLLEKTNRIANLLVSPLFILVFMALCVPFATRWATISGAIAGCATAVTVAFWQPILESFNIEPEFLKAISWQWIQPCALAAGIGVACAGSLLERGLRKFL
jgi:SSS family solute:Na+ symporter